MSTLWIMCTWKWLLIGFPGSIGFVMANLWFSMSKWLKYFRVFISIFYCHPLISLIPAILMTVEMLREQFSTTRSTMMSFGESWYLMDICHGFTIISILILAWIHKFFNFCFIFFYIILQTSSVEREKFYKNFLHYFRKIIKMLWSMTGLSAFSHTKW